MFGQLMVAEIMEAREHWVRFSVQTSSIYVINGFDWKKLAEIEESVGISPPPNPGIEREVIGVP